MPSHLWRSRESVKAAMPLLNDDNLWTWVDVLAAAPGLDEEDGLSYESVQDAGPLLADEGSILALRVDQVLNVSPKYTENSRERRAGLPGALF